MTSTLNLSILQPYVPKYREPFFNKLFVRLEQEGIICRVHSRSAGQHKSRLDSVDPDWLQHYRSHDVRLGNRSLALGGGRSSWLRADAVVLGLMGSSVDSYLAILDKRRRGLRVGFWGHIRSYVTAGNGIDMWLEKELMKRADHVFAYTQGGADNATERGVPSKQVTAVMNSIDTEVLEVERDLIRASPFEVEQFCTQHRLTQSDTFAFIGGLDSPKRIAFLVQSLEHLWLRAPHVKVLLAGHGPDERLLSTSIARGQVIKFGYANAHMQALMAASSAAFLMPGRIGLIAVEALVLGKPILSTNWAFHSAEKDYLNEGESIFSSDDHPNAYAALVEQFSERPTTVHDGLNLWSYPTMDNMVNRFSDGVLKMFEDGRK